MIRRFGLSLILFVMTTFAAYAGDFQKYSGDAFAKALSTGKPVVVHVHADWCPTCHRQIPTLESLSKDPALNEATFIQVNFDKDRDFLKKYRIVKQSVILVFRGGKEVERLNGVTNSGQIQSAVKAAAS